MSRRLSFTERRRRKLALKTSRLDRLETRNTITEPISVTGLSLSALRGMVQFGIMQADGGNGAALQLARAAHQAQQAPVRAHLAPTAPRDAAPIGILAHPRHPAGGAREAPIVPGAPGLKAMIRQNNPTDPLALTTSSDAQANESVGISLPWQPVSRAGGGAALPPRGGSGNGAQAAATALVQGHTAAIQSPPPPPTTPAIPFLPPANSGGAGGYGGAPVITRNAAAAKLAQGIVTPGSGVAHGGPTGPRLAADEAGGSSSGSTVVVENASSRPSSSAGNGSGFSQMSFPYFPLYVLDENDGVVLFNGQYQQTSSAGTIDLYAQVKGTTVSTYTWTYSNMTLFSSSGASTYYDSATCGVREECNRPNRPGECLSA
jgi:hypothetical protein